jgi:hypothetical protein
MHFDSPDKTFQYFLEKRVAVEFMAPKSTLPLNVVLTELTSPLNFAPLKTTFLLNEDDCVYYLIEKYEQISVRRNFTENCNNYICCIYISFFLPYLNHPHMLCRLLARC